MSEAALKILVIHDDDAIAPRLREALQNNSPQRLEASEASGIEEGLQLLSQGGLDAVLLSQNRRSINGFDPLKEISRNNRRIPVIVISPEADQSLVVDALKNGGAGFCFSRPPR